MGTHPIFESDFDCLTEGLQMPTKGNINIVHDEQIWRDHIKTEENALKSWESKWGFTKEIYPEMYGENTKKNEKEKSEIAKFPETTQKLYGWKKPNPLYQKLS